VSKRNSVLTIDDEVAVLRSLTSALAQYELTAIVAESGPQGLELFRKHHDEIFLVIADIVMPGMSGTVMARQMRNIDPDVKIILMSGYPEEEMEVLAKNEFPFMEKPIRAGDLLFKVESLVGPVMGLSSKLTRGAG